jgi:hypothetical protein
MNRSGKLLLFGGLCVLYLSFPMYMIRQKKAVVQKGIAYDWETPLSRPQESYRGYYLSIDFPAEYTYYDSIRKGDYLYARIRQINGRPQLTGLTPQKPAEGPYVRTRVRYRESSLVILDLPPGLSKVYIPKETYQRLSTEYEEALLGDRTDTGSVSVRLFVWKGRAEARLSPAGTQG